MTNLSNPKVLKIAGAILLAMAVAVMAYWGVSGAKMVTQYEVRTTVVEQDEFGDEVERERMVEQFQFGLLPDRGYDAAAPLAAGLSFLGLALLAAAHLKRRRDDDAGEAHEETEQRGSN